MRITSIFVGLSFFFVAACDDHPCPPTRDAGPAPTVDVPVIQDGYVVRGTFSLRGAAPTEATCTAENVARVRLRVLDVDAAILDEVTVPCAAGEIVGSTRLPWGVRHYGEWAALAPDGSVRESIPVSRRVEQARPASELNLLPVDFQPRPAEWGDFRAAGTLYVTEWTGPDRCIALGIDTMEVALAPMGGGETVIASSPCATARTEGVNGVIVVRTMPVLDWASTYEVTLTARGPDGAEVHRLVLGRVRVPEGTRVLNGLSGFVDAAGITPFI